MKFRVHVFREYRETYEVEADNHDDALNTVDEHINDLEPCRYGNAGLFAARVR